MHCDPDHPTLSPEDFTQASTQELHRRLYDITTIARYNLTPTGSRTLPATRRRNLEDVHDIVVELLGRERPNGDKAA